MIEISQRLCDFVTKLHASKSMDQAWDAFNDEVQSDGFAHALYGFMPTLPKKSLSREIIYFSSHDPKFMQEYEELALGDHDPWVYHVQRSISPIRWNDEEAWARMTKDMVRVENFAEDFGVHHGISFALRDTSPMAWGAVGLAAYKNQKSTETYRLLDAKQTELEQICQAFHEFVLANGYFNSFGLSPKEKEVLPLIVCGMDKHDIADRLKISYKTSEHHIYKIRRKLKCINDAQVTAKALVFNLL
jgi:DNA-binding CsgD family transcriptional regulator